MPCFLELVYTFFLFQHRCYVDFAGINYSSLYFCVTIPILILAGASHVPVIVIDEHF